jgi:hypothetical protein
MRASVLLVPLVPLALCVACQQELDVPAAAPACDPKVMRCVFTPPPAMGTDGNAGGDSAVGEETATFSGSILAFDDDYFDKGAVFTGMAKVSATGESGARVTTDYDGTTFQLNKVLKDSGNWFFVEPAEGSGMLPTLMPLDTRTAKADTLTVGVVNGVDVDSIFSFLNTERSAERAQVVLSVVDGSLRSVPGVKGTLTAEVTAYRAAGGWIGDDVTDNSGMIFFGNVQAGSALSTISISLSGPVTTRVDIKVTAGAVTVVSAIVNP